MAEGDGAWPGRAMDRLFAVYMLISAAALFFPHRRPLWLLLLAAHVPPAALAHRVPPFGELRRVLRARLPRA